jgi:hypothetical protein
MSILSKINGTDDAGGAAVLAVLSPAADLSNRSSCIDTQLFAADLTFCVHVDRLSEVPPRFRRY